MSSNILSRFAGAVFNPSIPELIDIDQTDIAGLYKNPRLTFTSDAQARIFVVEPSSNYFYFDLNERDGKATWQSQKPGILF